jgi:CubicO group peptidase (beta-lactamase class C family)
MIGSKVQQSGPIDPKEFEFFLDVFINKKMEEYHIPGLVFVLVKDGDVFFTKGYGFADIEQNKPVIPAKTVFRVGSVSKVFTATAVMQLVERGDIDLNANVNQYLKLFKLEENYSKPVTMANLLTHSAGFRGRGINTWTRKESERLPLGAFLAENMPL